MNISIDITRFYPGIVTVKSYGFLDYTQLMSLYRSQAPGPHYPLEAEKKSINFGSHQQLMRLLPTLAQIYGVRGEVDEVNHDDDDDDNYDDDSNDDDDLKRTFYRER